MVFQQYAAVVGASGDVDKAANGVPDYLQSMGYRIVPVSPRGGEILGERVYSSLMDVDVPVDVVQVFRPPREVPRRWCSLPVRLTRQDCAFPPRERMAPRTVAST